MGFETLEAVENLQMQLIELKKENLEKNREISELRQEMLELKKKVEGE
ncbi:MAG: hypothetical protein KJ607_02065 [Bacteroidetes bacterium]|nr:hypothetical protein [Bacteroidota bacterium]